jgi:FkbM family methyltransferase
MLIKKNKELFSLKSHSYRSRDFKKLKKNIKNIVLTKFKSINKKIFLHKDFSFFHPKISFGNISSLNLLEIDELLIFQYYLKNYPSYSKFIDIGANIGVHSIINSKLGLKVEAYEPDPKHISLMKKNIKNNNAIGIKVYQCAVSTVNSKMLFTRVLGNTTGSHLTGAKKNVYNDVKQFKVKVVQAKKIIKKNYLVKIDAEGEESKILSSLKKNHFMENDFICEIGSKENAKIIYQKLKKEKINSYAQKINFKKVKKLKDIPTSYKEGTLFISSKNIWKI